MHPSFARAYIPYRSRGDFVLSGDSRSVFARVCSDRQDLHIRETRTRVSFAALLCSVCFLVSMIATSRPPAKIVEAVVCSHPVAMAALTVYRGVAPECQQNESMDEQVFPSAMLTRADPRVAVAPAGLFQNTLKNWFSLAVQATHGLDAPEIADLVQALVAANGSPDFAHSQLPKVDRDEVRGSWHGDQLSGATLATQRTV